MPRNCNCAGGACSCLIVQGPGASVTGSGNADDPYIIGFSAAGFVQIDTAGGTLDLGALNLNTSLVITVNLSGDITIGLPAIPPPPGVRIDLLLVQIGGPHTVTVPGPILFPGGTNPTLVGPTADWLALVYSGAQWFGFSRVNMA